MKTETQTYTPGPWFVKVVAGSKCNWAIDDAEKNEHVATAWGTEHAALANARLIAAAPDLLEAAKLWLETMRQNNAPEYSIQMRIVRAAINKAEGR